jgi:hypothetical protein
MGDRRQPTASWRLDFERDARGRTRLVRSTFRQDATKEVLVADKSLKPTAGVQALAILALRTAAGRWRTEDATNGALKGGRPSLAASLSDAVKNCPSWLREAFGEAHGIPYASCLLVRANHEANRRDEPMSVRVNEEAIRREEIRIFVSGRESRSPYELERAALELESAWLAARDPNLRQETRRAIEALAKEARHASDQSRLDAFLGRLASLLDEAAVMIVENGDLPFTGQSRGREAILRRMALNFGAIAEHQVNVYDVVTTNDSIVILGRDTFRMQGESIVRSANYAQRYVMRNGKLVLIHHVSQKAGDVETEGAAFPPF